MKTILRFVASNDLRIVASNELRFVQSDKNDYSPGMKSNDP